MSPRVNPHPLSTPAALTQAAAAAGLRDVTIAAQVGVTEKSVRSWRSGVKSPSSDNFRTLIRVVPGFAALVGLAVVEPCAKP